LSLVASAVAHGYISRVVIANTTYYGPAPSEGNPPNATGIVRQLNTTDPITNLDATKSPYLACGWDALPADHAGSAAPGDKVQLYWNTKSDRWPHQVGPLMTYMASCGNRNFSDVTNTSELLFFKIAEAGLIENRTVDDSEGDWYQNFIALGYPTNVTIPFGLEAGNYLLRTEIISLQRVTSGGIGDAEFYPSCSQLIVTGDGTSVPSDSELLEFPGAYNATDPGLTVNPYDMTGPYTFPGGPIATPFTLNGSANPSSSSSPTPSSPPLPPSQASASDTASSTTSS
ncbi:glycosyl hydrolase family 61-domain-containing protein, partial [Mycena galopus ATCC 62051]